MEIKKEYWVEILKGRIPEDSYTASLNVRDTDFTDLIYLQGKKYRITISFDRQFEVRYFNRKLYMTAIIEASEYEKYANSAFENVIYEVKNSKLIEDFAYRGIFPRDYSDFQHYVFVATNAVIEFLAFDELVIRIQKLSGDAFSDEMIIDYSLERSEEEWKNGEKSRKDSFLSEITLWIATLMKKIPSYFFS